MMGRLKFRYLFWMEVVALFLFRMFRLVYPAWITTLYTDSDYVRNMIFIRAMKGTISVLEKLKENTVEGEDSRLWEHLEVEDPDNGLTLQARPLWGDRAVSWRERPTGWVLKLHLREKLGLLFKGIVRTIVMFSIWEQIE